MSLAYPQITLLYAGILALFYCLLSLYVVRQRWAEKVSLGYNRDPKSVLFKAVRIHGNFSEYIPFFITLMALDEMTGRSATTLHIIGAVLIISRIGHAIGLRHFEGANPFRFLSMGTNFLLLIVFGVF